MSKRIVRASVIQCCTEKYDLEATLRKLERLVHIAKERDGAELAVFPEAFIGGYPRGRSFGCVVGTRSDEGRQEYLDYYNSAIEVPGPAVSRIEEVAKRYDVFLVVGVIEKYNGTLYCSVIWVDPAQGLVEQRRKLMPTAAEKLIWGQGSHDDVKVVSARLPDSDIGPSRKVKVSATICWENYMPLFRYATYNLGAEIYCAPTVDGRDSWGTTMKHIAFEGRCFVLSANQFSQRKDHPADVDLGTEDPEDVVIAGGSMIVDPQGRVLAGPLRGKEGVLTAVLDLDEIIRAKMDLDVTGHYSRADIFQLNVRQC